MKTCIISLLAVLALSLAGVCIAGEPAPVRFVSSSPGYCFTDSEKPDVRIRLEGKLAAAQPGVATVEFSISETDGPWKDTGKLTIPAGKLEAPLPLKLPGRGLYRLAANVIAGTEKAKCETWIAVVFTPARPTAESPWGIFYTPPLWFDPKNPDGAHYAAVLHRLLGASWSRLNFWEYSFGKVTVQPGERDPLTADFSLWKSYASELRKEGIFIMGEIAQCPRVLSSRPDDVTKKDSDQLVAYSIAPPKEYALWDNLMEKVASEFAQDIQVWEVWNEPDLTGSYWLGTPEEYAELLEHTSHALRKGNPKTRIAAAGFAQSSSYADKLFSLGAGTNMDILSIHYTDQKPGAIDAYRNVMKKYNLNLPIWNTEEKSEVPLDNLANGVERIFKFIHVEVAYGGYRPLLNKDWTVKPSGILFSVGAHCIGTGKYAKRIDTIPGYHVYFFKRGDEIIGVLDSGQNFQGIKLFGSTPTAVRLTVEPLAVDQSKEGPRVTDTLGRTRPMALVNGHATLQLSSGMRFINGCQKLEVSGVEGQAGSPDGLVFEAETGRFSKGWRVSGKDRFSAGRVLELSSKDEPDADGYWAEVKLAVAKAGRYELCFSGNALTRLKTPRSLSPFMWNVDNGDKHVVDDALAVVEGVTGAPEGLAVLGVVELTAGEHTFRLVVDGRCEKPDQKYAFCFDAIGLRSMQ